MCKDSSEQNVFYVLHNKPGTQMRANMQKSLNDRMLLSSFQTEGVAWSWWNCYD